MIRANGKIRNGLIAALDVGSSKVCCLIARQDGGVLRVVGSGHQVSKGIRNGLIANMEQAEGSILAAIQAAEDMAKDTLKQVVVNVSGNHLASHLVSMEVPIPAREIGQTDLKRVLAYHPTAAENGRRQLIHSIPVDYSVDGHCGIRDPLGMFGERLGANLHVVTGAGTSLRNLTTCVARAHLDVEALVVAPYASGLSCLVEDEVDLGVTIIDMGAGTTTMAVFLNGTVIHTDGIPVGGLHVTNDIARGLSTPIAHAERLKTLHGHATRSPADDREVIDVPLIGEETREQPNHVPKSMLVGIIQPRMEEIFEMVRARLEAGGYDKVAGRRLVLTGGASQLAGVAELAAVMLDKQVRLGRPMRIAGLAELMGGPAFATAAGLLTYAVRRHDEVLFPALPAAAEANNLIGRFGVWLRENF